VNRDVHTIWDSSSRERQIEESSPGLFWLAREINYFGRQ
jgi:hypothetical protein